MTAVKQSPAGYQYFVEKYQLQVVPHFRQSYITTRGAARTELNHNTELHIYPKPFLPKESMRSQLEFSIKYDGINLEILRAIFETVSKDEIIQLINSQPSKKYIRKIWFLYEFLFGCLLPIDNLSMGNYIDLLPNEDYFTAPTIKCPRQRINNNLLGDVTFCPMVRKTSLILHFIDKDLSRKAAEIFQKYPSNIVHRANQFLYLKETKSSFAIEREQPNLKRTNRFVQALHEIEQSDALTKKILIELQNTIVEERFADQDYRKSQNYVGQSLPGYRQKIYYISPRPQDLDLLMQGFLNLVNRLQYSQVDSVVTAACCAFAFVYLHPFEDGNGRLHRLLIHYLLARTGFTPKGVILPVSAVMLAEPQEYDACLDVLSKPLLNLIDYHLNDDGSLSVNNKTIDFYRYFDATAMVEYLYKTINKTIETDLIQELEFILNYDHAKQQIQDVVDLPDNKIDLFIKIALDHSGKISKAKKNKFFNFLSDEEIEAFEHIIKINFFK